jgi:hypothetical protein
VCFEGKQKEQEFILRQSESGGGALLFDFVKHACKSGGALAHPHAAAGIIA